ncbi:hypothetical protein KJS94_01805 [Flavihumibacter rivuli]|uniref:RHS repeat domain-containing protein n=1 Tax=Flavihumibacter rivuli TaxID=2838156 RepID=UPI001BDE9126|nr:hypothetical protein [Flavihumibacter rivuli]ULQ56929.1 hypothetical protein KJS94_01805 [Flavihumibacter rivuli]
MKKILLSLTLFCSVTVLKAQYYFKDIITTNQTNQLFIQLKQNQVRKVAFSSYEGNSAESAGFTGEQQIDPKRNSITTITRTTVVGEAFLTTYYNEAGLLVRTTDSAQNASNSSEYTYDAQKRLVSIAVKSQSDNVTTTEKHLWSYDAKGLPAQMLRIRNNTDTTTVSFQYDERGNVVEEKAIRKNLPPVTVYYYYDALNRLTDVVRYNAKAKRLLPDYMFEYNEGLQLKKMITVPEGSNEYLTWYYQYLPNGLKRMDLCYNKQQQLMGKVEYEYE